MLAWFKKAFYLGAAFLLVAFGLWVVIANEQPFTLHLFFWQLPELNVGFIVLLAFAVGAITGILVGLNLFTLFKLNTRVFMLKRELRQLQDTVDQRHTDS